MQYTQPSRMSLQAMVNTEDAITMIWLKSNTYDEFLSSVQNENLEFTDKHDPVALKNHYLKKKHPVIYGLVKTFLVLGLAVGLPISMFHIYEPLCLLSPIVFAMAFLEINGCGFLWKSETRLIINIDWHEKGCPIDR